MSIQISAKMRRKTYQGFFILTVLSLAGIPTFFKLFFEQGQSIAVVDGIAITPLEYQEEVYRKEQQLAALRNRLKEMNLSDEMLRAFGINTNTRESALDELINKKMIASVAQQLHVNLDRDYVAQVLRNPQALYSYLADSIPHELISQHGTIDVQRLKLFLQKQGKTIESFDAVIEEKMKQQLVLALVQGAGVVSSAAITEATLQQHAPKSFAVTTISYAPYIKALEKQQLPAEEVHAFFTKHNTMSHRYWAPEKRSGTVWVFKQIGKAIQDFEQRFMRDVQGMLSAPREALVSFAQQKNGASHTITGTAEQATGTELQALFSLMQGRRTAYVQDGVGYIVELTTLEKSAARPFDQVKGEVVKDMYQERAQARVAEIINKLSTGSINDLGLIEGSMKSFTVKVAPQDEAPLASLQKQGIATEKMKRMFLQNQRFMGSTDTMGYKVELTHVGASEATAEDTRAMIASLERENEGKIAYDFIASLREHATIVMNKSLLKGM